MVCRTLFFIFNSLRRSTTLDTNLLRQFGEVLTRKKAKLNQRIVIFTFFLVVATILWYLNKLGYEYDTELAFPVRFENFPNGKVVVGEPPHHLSMRVKTYGYTLLKHKLVASISPLVIDLERTPLLQFKRSDSKFFLTAAGLRSSIASQLRGDLQLISVHPDTLFFELTSLTNRKVPVKPDLRLSFEKQHMQSAPISIEPDSVVISGPKTIIDTIAALHSQEIRLDKLTSTAEQSAVLSPIQQVAFSVRKVEVRIPVEKFTEATFSCPIDIKNLPPNIRLILLPRTVNIKCNIPLSHYSTLGSGCFEAYVDFNSIDNSLGNTIRVHTIPKKEFISNFDFEPKFVEFFIEKM